MQLWGPAKCLFKVIPLSSLNSPGYCLKNPLALPKYCHMRDGSLSKLSTKTLLRASDQYTPFTIAESEKTKDKKEEKDDKSDFKNPQLFCITVCFNRIF